MPGGEVMDADDRGEGEAAAGCRGFAKLWHGLRDHAAISRQEHIML